MGTMTKSEQARADALADAETLRLNYPGVIAYAAGDWSGKYLCPCPVDHAYVTATGLASAAFRAVPGLRG